MAGDIGPSGMSGMDGIDGANGPKGEPGRDCSESSDVDSGILLVKHSQSTAIPRCDYGQTELWHGYSLLYVDGNDYAHNQDLGSPGSCVKTFSTMPALSCGVDNVCNYASRNDRTFWLSTNAEAPMMPVGGREIVNYISRCVVCEIPQNVITLHSQTRDVPECPRGWEGVWHGYSFLMVRFVSFRFFFCFCCLNGTNCTYHKLFFLSMYTFSTLELPTVVVVKLCRELDHVSKISELFRSSNVMVQRDIVTSMKQ